MRRGGVDGRILFSDADFGEHQKSIRFFISKLYCTAIDDKQEIR
jgi:hypothetical protein